MKKRVTSWLKRWGGRNVKNDPVEMTQAIINSVSRRITESASPESADVFVRHALEQYRDMVVAPVLHTVHNGVTSVLRALQLPASGVQDPAYEAYLLGAMMGLLFQETDKLGIDLGLIVEGKKRESEKANQAT